MATGSTTSSSSISDIDGYCAFAEVLYGSNGAAQGEPEVNVGAINQAPSAGRKTWDANTSDGIDSSTVSVQLVAEAGGGTNALKMSVAGASPSPLQYSGATYGAIQRVRIRAAVQTTAKVQWGSVVVAFYRMGRTAETYTHSGGGPGVDTRNATLPVTAEQILEVVPAFSNNTKVVVIANVQFVANQGVVPGAEDLFGQIFVDTVTCST